MKKIIAFAYLIPIIFHLQSCNQREGAIIPDSGLYPGCKLPGNEPGLFAPGLITGSYQTRDVAISPNGKEIYFGARISRYYTIFVIKRDENGWSDPSVLEHMENPDYMNIEPALSYDGSRFFFLSSRPDSIAGIEEGQQDIWVMDKTDDGWGEPYNLGPPVNTEQPGYYPSLTADGSIYFTRNEPNSSNIAYIYRSRYVNGSYQEPEKLPAQVNSGLSHYNAFVSPDESFIIVPTAGREDSYGGTDYYIIFRNRDDTWSEPINLGDKINTPDTFEYSAYLSRDGKYLFFMSRRFEDPPEKLSFEYLNQLNNRPESGNPSIYWMAADSLINSLREQAVFSSK